MRHLTRPDVLRVDLYEHSRTTYELLNQAGPCESKVREPGLAEDCEEEVSHSHTRLRGHSVVLEWISRPKNVLVINKPEGSYEVSCMAPVPRRIQVAHFEAFLLQPKLESSCGFGDLPCHKALMAQGAFVVERNSCADSKLVGIPEIPDKVEARYLAHCVR